MEEKIIDRYRNSNVSIEQIAKEFKIGKIKVKRILSDNNIPIKKKGGQNKNRVKKEFTIEINNKIIKCKKCGKEFNDTENKSGAPISHIRICFPDVNIQTKLKRFKYKEENGSFWHFQYFVLIEKCDDNRIKIKCPECEWETTDITNKSGSLTKHISCNHGLLNDFILKHKEYEYLFNKFISKANIEEYYNASDENFVICKICGESFKTISNTHLKLHSISPDQYKNKFGEDSLVSETTKKIFIQNLKDIIPSLSYRSEGEKEIEQFILSLGINVDVCNKKILSGTEIDLFLPEYNIGIEYNGLYWHSENQGKNKSYHLDKTKKCLSVGVRLIHIFSDEWISKKDIIKNRLLNLLHKNDNKIYARKCKILFINKKEKKDFLNKTHLQGNDKSSIMIGLKYNDQIVAVATFGNLRNSLGNKTKKDNVFELYRFSSLNVVGGFNRLLKFFVKEFSPKKIITYADRNWSPSNDFCFYGNVAGFTLVSETKPNYSYTKKYDKREHRFNYRKDILVKMGFNPEKSESQIMMENGYDRIWDTGNLKYEINF
jgi:hypothetical protein